jgi:epoxyqueuosine reductase
MKERIREQARELGFDDCRFTTAQPPESAPALQAWIQAGKHGTMAYLERNAAKRCNPNQVLPNAQSIITLASSYLPPSPAPLTDAAANSEPKGVVARYARYADYHEILGQALAHLVSFMDGLRPGERSLWYVDTGPLLERDFAQRSGLGFIGKHTNVISRKLGNWIFLSEIITTLPLPPDAPEINRCGSCTRCIAACPTQAILEPFQLDARRCISYLTIELKGSIPLEFREAMGNRIYGCDDCLAACPWNRFAQAGRAMTEHFRADLTTPHLLTLLELDDAGFKRKFSGTPMLRTKRRGLLRNVCVALGNVGDASALPGLERAATDPEPLIAEHAAWAISSIRSRMEKNPNGAAPKF